MWEGKFEALEDLELSEMYNFWTVTFYLDWRDELFNEERFYLVIYDIKTHQSLNYILYLVSLVIYIYFLIFKIIMETEHFLLNNF